MPQLIYILLAFLSASEPVIIRTQEQADNSHYDNLRLGVPSFQNVIIIDRRGFAVGFSPKYKVPLWVCYIMSADEVLNKAAVRSNRFKADPCIKSSGNPKDYARSGYDRGHLAPSADLCFSVDAMQESFYMSNIAPQIPAVNRKIWKALEEFIRTAAVREKKIAIVTDCIFDKAREIKYIGNKVAVPHAFYKVVLDLTEPCKAIGFIIRHEATDRPFTAFSCTVDDVEAVTGLDFFNRFSAAPEQENNIEAWFAR